MNALRSIKVEDIQAILDSNPLTRQVLGHVAALGLPDWGVGAGFVRNQIWDYMHGYPVTRTFTDIDVLYYNAGDTSKVVEDESEDNLRRAMPGVDFEVRNQARMHEKKGEPPYRDMEDGIRHWTETATAIAVRVDGAFTPQAPLTIIAPHGLDDLLNLVLRPTFHYHRTRAIERATAKGWKSRWPNLSFIDC